MDWFLYDKDLLHERVKRHYYTYTKYIFHKGKHTFSLHYFIPSLSTSQCVYSGKKLNYQLKVAFVFILLKL